MARKKEQEMPSAFFVENEHLGLGVPLRDLFRPCESFFVRSVLITVGIVKEVAAVAVDYAHDYIARQKRTLLPQRSLTGSVRRGAARKQKQPERQATTPPKSIEHTCVALAKERMSRASPTEYRECSLH